MDKLFTSLGLMSGTSVDGVDASIIKTDGKDKFELISDHYYEYPSDLNKELLNLVEKIQELSDLKHYSSFLNKIERKITLFNARIIKEVLNQTGQKIDFVGYHGQTVYHNANLKVSKQLGNAKLLSDLIKLNVVHTFRENDLKNGGQGAPLTPIYHKLLSVKLNLNSVLFLNIGGILNVTSIYKNTNFVATDIGPGMCLLDKWIRLNSKFKYDIDGKISSKGKINNNLNYQLDNFFHFEKKNLNKKYIKSFDVSDFDLSFIRGLSTEDGAATLIEYSVKIIIDYYLYIIKFFKIKNFKPQIILCGGGRKNKHLVKRLNLNFQKYKITRDNNLIKSIDEFNINGDFIESQAFAYLAVRSFLKLPISFPDTTNCKRPITGGEIYYLNQ